MRARIVKNELGFFVQVKKLFGWYRVSRCCIDTLFGDLDYPEKSYKDAEELLEKYRNNIKKDKSLQIINEWTFDE